MQDSPQEMEKRIVRMGRDLFWLPNIHHNVRGRFNMQDSPLGEAPTTSRGANPRFLHFWKTDEIGKRACMREENTLCIPFDSAHVSFILIICFPIFTLISEEDLTWNDSRGIGTLSSVPIWFLMSRTASLWRPTTHTAFWRTSKNCKK